MPGFFSALWAYRNFIWASVMREFAGKYRESLLGAFWSVANPLTMIIIYTLIFSQLLKPSLPGHSDNPFAFSIYLCAGVISWTLFADMLARLSNVFLEHGNLIKKSSFPRVCLPVIVAFSALINYAIILGLFLIFLASVGHWPGWTLLALLPLLLLQILFTLGLGVFLGTLNVFFRDVGQFVGVVLQFWFWLTPIVYTVQILPEDIQALMQLNPLQPLFASYQGVFLEMKAPDPGELLPLTVLTLFFLLLGGRFFLARVGEMVDEL